MCAGVRVATTGSRRLDFGELPASPSSSSPSMGSMSRPGAAPRHVVVPCVCPEGLGGEQGLHKEHKRGRDILPHLGAALLGCHPCPKGRTLG